MTWAPREDEPLAVKAGLAWFRNSEGDVCVLHPRNEQLHRPVWDIKPDEIAPWRSAEEIEVTEAVVEAARAAAAPEALHTQVGHCAQCDLVRALDRLDALRNAKEGEPE